MFRDVIISLLATLAKQELIRLSERVHASLERARAQGKKLDPRPQNKSRARPQKRRHEPSRGREGSGDKSYVSCAPGAIVEITPTNPRRAH